MDDQPALDPVRIARVTTALEHDERDPERSLCVASANVARVSGAGVVLILHGRALGTVCCSDAVTELVEEVQFTLGEGPCIDAFNTRKPVFIPDLGDDHVVRWPGFRAGALAVGVRGAFGFPILVGPVCIGALNLYQQRSGPLSNEQVADAEVLAHIAGRVVMGWQSVAGEGSLARQLEHLPGNRAVVHQATGMVSVQAAVSVDDAIALLRAYAFASDRPVHEVAAGVVNRDLRFD